MHSSSKMSVFTITYALTKQYYLVTTQANDNDVLFHKYLFILTNALFSTALPE